MSLNPPLEKATTSFAESDAESLAAPSRSTEAVADLAAGLSRRWIWARLAYQDIKMRYGGRVLGPFWVTLTNLIMIAAMGTIYSILFHLETATFVPYVMAGLLVWQFISGMINDGCYTFTAAADVIQQVPMPFSVQAYRVVYRNVLLLAHNAIIVPFGLAIFAVPVNWRLLEVIPAVIVLCVNGLSVAIFLGAISARLRDIPPIVSNVVQVVFFITPIFWPMTGLSNSHLQLILVLNPFFAALDVARAPLLGVAPESSSWPMLLACTAVGCLGSFIFFVRFRERIAYWV
jgi:ABC-2 type transport system permease protein/lipopolysaccharide transport system permease protein